MCFVLVGICDRQCFDAVFSSVKIERLLIAEVTKVDAVSARYNVLKIMYLLFMYVQVL